MWNLVILDLAAYLADFEPLHVADCFAGASDRVGYRVFNAVWGRTDEFDLFVDVVTHERIKSFNVASGEQIRRSNDATDENSITTCVTLSTDSGEFGSVGDFAAAIQGKRSYPLG